MSDVSEPFDPANFITLYFGDTDADPPTGWASYLQQRLIDNGVDPGNVDGIFGPRTADAVKAVQSSGGATADGVVGNQTWGILHGAFGVPGGHNRERPHRGGGGGGGGHDLTKDRIFFSTTPFYSHETDSVHFELVMTQGTPFAPGDLLAHLTVTGPNGSFDMDQNFTAESELAPTRSISLTSIRIAVTSPGNRIGVIVLDSGRGDSRTFSFEPNFVGSE